MGHINSTNHASPYACDCLQVENKQYSRELARDHIHSGRVRIQLKDDDGSPCNPGITSSKY